MVKNIAIFILLCFTCMRSNAQDCFARIELNKRSVYVQEPFRVTIRVLTKTWYTAPLDFDNIQIPSAFILPFDRTQSGMFPVGDKQYAGLEFYFIVFPYKAGTFTIPPIHIVATTPPEGSAESKKVTLTTAPQKIVVKDVPASLKTDNWFVAKGVNISERWNKSLRNLKVGDVIVRTITIDAKGTLPQFIPEVAKEKPDWASIYPDDAELEDTRDENDANGRRIESITYLLEKAGDFKIPPIKVTWWNPNNSRKYEKSTTSLSIHIKENPNLGILTTLKDSLKTTQKITKPPEKKKGPYLIYGIPWYWFSLYALVALAVLYVLVRMTISLVRWLIQKRRHYLNSEQHWFNRFMHSANNSDKVINGLYQWWDRSGIANKSASAVETLTKDKETAITNEITNIYREVYKGENASATTIEQKQLKSAVKKYRRKKKLSNDQLADKISDNQKLWQ
ncbi:BatD family protein [Pinibacter aurantiacus]|uniref:BatD family protein n=1 Tax=Pinibacter aurantiacus TaxID=2851599 RepID=A0A9E2SFI9_9BACT|nr:BatD family protein [Pinibacter aurantiacus]MBV4360449.1 BatD family protein [Pinibacter aurantiacus]